MSSKVLSSRKNTILSYISGLIVSISITLIGILLFAVCIRFFNISDNWIFPINQIIKIISILLGVLVVLKKTKKNGFINGIIFGLLYYLINFIVFSILQGSFAVVINNLYDMLLTTFSAGLIGVILIHLVK